ncbi:MAG: hypothetical protein QF473_30590 [Planctomycetota bacterium]|jgi:hypothetical protein|nr:hypothetical protein [Planctomycetota bacterium]
MFPSRLFCFLALPFGAHAFADNLPLAVLPYATDEPHLDRFIQSESTRRKVLKLSSSEFSRQIESFNGLLITAREGFRQDWVDPLKRFVQRGGKLVFFGRAGRFIDANDNGRYDHGTDRLGISELDALTGSRIELVGFHALRLRVFEDNPLFAGFDVGRWIECPTVDEASFVKLTPGKSVFLGGVYLAHKKLKQGEGFPGASYNQALFAGESPLVTAHSFGKGLAIRVAGDLFRLRTSPMYSAILKNLLASETWQRLHANLSTYGTVQPVYGGGNLLNNGHIETLYFIREKPPRKDNRVTELPYHWAAGWHYNAYIGFFRGMARRTEKGHALFLESVDGSENQRNGGSNFRQERPMNRLQNGKSYALSIRSRGEAVHRSSASIVYHLNDGQRISRAFDLPGDTYDWKKSSFTFDLPRFVPKGKEPARGFTLYLHLSVTGRIWFDDIRLGEIK